MPFSWLANLFAYSVQIAGLLAAAGLALALLRLHTPQWRLLCWQLVLAACLLLPMLQPWQPSLGGVSVEFTTRVRPVQRPRPNQTVNWTRVYQAVAIVLIAGTSLRLGIFALGFARLRAYRRRASPEPALALDLERRLGIRVEIGTSEEVPGPVTFGFLRPVVLLPARWIESESVLFHELLHVRRRDWLFMVSEEFIRALFWFHPLVWYAIAQIQLAREEAVDREVIELTQSREQYLETLLAIAAARSGLDLAPAPLFLRKRHLRQRVASLINEVRMSRLRLNFSLAGFLALTAAAGWVTMRAFPLQAAPQDAPQESAKQKPTLVYKAPVEYPAAMKDSGVECTVTVRIEIDKEGDVVNAYAVTGPNEFRDEALNSIRKWKFTKNTPSEATVEVNFRDEKKSGAASQESSPTRIRVGGNVQSAHLIKKVTPAYPSAAKQARIQGSVRLNVIIAADGSVSDVQVESGDPELTNAAVSAVRQWMYQPTLLNGNPVEVATVVDVNFTLTQ